MSHCCVVTEEGRFHGTPAFEWARLRPSESAPLRGSDISSGISGALDVCGDSVWVHKASSSSEESEG